MTLLYPMAIQPRYVDRIWGGDELASRLGKPAPRGGHIGESWEIYEDNTVLNGALAGRSIGELRRLMGTDLTGHVSPDELFPLLTKFIDAHQALSVQVHPDDRFAREQEHQPYGKTECWYVIHAEPGATLTYGFARDSSPDEYTSLVERGALEEVLRSLSVTAGDVVYIPAGTVHAIGPGIVVYELQQTSDTTYRIYDWNRRDEHGQSRELHVQKAKGVLDYHRETQGTIEPLDRPGSGRSTIIAGQYFCQELLTAGVAGPQSTHRSAVAICALGDGLQVTAGGESLTLGAYSSALIPAAVETYTIGTVDGGGGAALALAAYVPESRTTTEQELRHQGFSSEEIGPFLAQFAPSTDLGQAVAGSP